jgi:hypothetical protein
MVRRVLVIVVFLFLGTGFVLISPFFLDTAFVVLNENNHEVYVTAYWRNEVKEIGIIKPSAQYEFWVEDEAAMKFSVRYSNGKELESSEIYFTSSTVVLANISESGIDVRYDFDN